MARTYVALWGTLVALVVTLTGSVVAGGAVIIAGLLVGVPKAWTWAHDQLGAGLWLIGLTLAAAGEIIWVTGGASAHGTLSTHSGSRTALVLTLVGGFVAVLGYFRRWGTGGSSAAGTSVRNERRGCRARGGGAAREARAAARGRAAGRSSRLGDLHELESFRVDAEPAPGPHRRRGPARESHPEQGAVHRHLGVQQQPGPGPAHADRPVAELLERIDPPGDDRRLGTGPWKRSLSARVGSSIASASSTSRIFIVSAVRSSAARSGSSSGEVTRPASSGQSRSGERRIAIPISSSSG